MTAFLLGVLALLKFVAAFMAALICTVVIVGGIALLMSLLSYFAWRRKS